MSTGLSILSIFCFVSAGIIAVNPCDNPEPVSHTIEAVADSSITTHVFKVNGEVVVEKRKGAEAPIQSYAQQN